MTLLSGLGIVLSLVFGCLLLALMAELYYLLWWKKQRIMNKRNSRIGAEYSTHNNKELFYISCWDRPSSVITHPSSNIIIANPEINHHHDTDVELGNKDLVLKALGEDGVESEIMRLHNLVGPPRFLFTINEETKEDLESEDGKSRADNRSRKGSRTLSLGDLVALDHQTHSSSPSPFFSPMASPPLKFGPNNNNNNNKNNYDNPLFESSVVEAELNRLRSSPPPTFKFLRDAEEKMYRKLLEEAQKARILKEVVVNGGMKNKEREVVHCSTLQVLPLASSPPDSSAFGNDENKPSLHH